MRVLIDACVLYPTVMRQIVLGAAEAGVFVPLWSPRILDEWAHAAARIGQDALARGEIAVLTARWPESSVTVSAETETRLHLPDANDHHVLAAAIDGNAEALMTLNLKDFPTRILTAEGIVRRDPDGFLVEAYLDGAEAVATTVATVLEKARSAGVEGSQRAVLKRARLPRLGKTLYGNSP